MAPKEPTRAQLSSKLSYQQSVPSFLTKFKNRMAGVVDEDDEEDEEFEHVGDGREPIPRRPRPAIPERPADDPGSADEDGYDERPQVVVLREGKHLTAREAENVRRKEKGLPPLPEPDIGVDLPEPDPTAKSSWKKQDSATAKSSTQGLSFSSSSKSSSANVKSAAKRKAVGQLDGDDDDKQAAGKAPTKKKAKKQNKKLLSFGDDA